MSLHAHASVVSTYVLLLLALVYMLVFEGGGGHTYIRARFTAVYIYRRVTTAVSVHIITAGTFNMPASCH